MKKPKLLPKHMQKTQETLIYSTVAALCFIILGLMVSVIYKKPSFIYNFILISVVIFIFPFFLVKYLHFREVKDCESYFPTFLDDLKEAKSSGVSFPQAILSCRGEYGALNKHIKKLQQDISWEVSIDDALARMSKNLKDSKIISKSVSILIETYRSGGNVENIINTLRESLLKIMESEDYKKSIMQQHVMMMYGVFLMYIALIILLGHFLMPMLQQMSKTSSGGDMAGLGIMSATSPCESCNGGSCKIICGLFGVIADMFGFGTNPLQVYYKSLFLMMAMCQGLLSGIIAGQISNKSWIDGAKHGLIMMVMGFTIIIMANAIHLF